MQAHDNFLLKFLHSSEKLTIPVYQRYYSWTNSECLQLFNDIVKLCKKIKLNKDKENSINHNHFLGSIVSFSNAKREILIIDGQQRITTISLLLLAMNELNKQEIFKTTLKKDEILNKYLKDLYSEEIKLIPIEKDKAFYDKLFDEKTEEINVNNNIINNYKFFLEKIKNLQDIEFDEFFEAIKEIKFVDVKLEENDDPQVIFESLNSTGLSLTEAEKIKNLLLMKSKNQDDLYKKYWLKIEENIKDKEKIDRFIRDCLTVKHKNNEIPNINQIYKAFKEFFHNEIDNLKKSEEILQDLLQYSKYYGWLLNANFPNEEINKLILQANDVEIGTAYPFLLQTFRLYEEKILNDNQIEKILKLIVSFIFRRYLCDLPTKVLNKIFNILYRDIKREFDILNIDEENYGEKFYDILKAILGDKKNYQRFPNNEELREKLKVKDVYNIQKKKEYLLFSLNNFNNKEIIDRENISIEHIIPQNPINWKGFLKEELGEEWQAFHEKYLHTIGNLTLTGYNSEMSNRSFLEKRDMPNGFRESSIKLNQFLINLEKFGKKELEERASILIDKVIQIWHYSESNFELKYKKSKENQEFSFSLSDEEIDITGKKPKKITLKINEIDFGSEVESWKDCFRFILTEINENCDAEKFNNMVNVKTYNIQNSRFLAYPENEDFGTFPCLKIGNLKFFIGYYGSTELLNRMKKYCEYFDINLDDVIVVCG